MDGQTNYSYQPGTPADAIRMHRHGTLSTVVIAATREEHQPNSRHQFDNIVSYGKSGWAASTCSRAACSGAGCTTSRDYTVQGDHYADLQQRRPDRGPPVQHAGEPEEHRARCIGFFFQDAWSIAAA